MLFEAPKLCVMVYVVLVPSPTLAVKVETPADAHEKLPEPSLVRAPAALERALILMEESRSAPSAVMNMTAEPDRLSRDPVLDCDRVLDSVVPEDVYVPVPVSQAVPSSMAYETTAPFGTPAPAGVWYPVTADPTVTVPVPVVAVLNFTRS